MGSHVSEKTAVARVASVLAERRCGGGRRGHQQREKATGNSKRTLVKVRCEQMAGGDREKRWRQSKSATALRRDSDEEERGIG